jgi:DNA mismatch repair protein MutL
MLDVIQLLPDKVANQIAAGEVIQRPASAVKELLENAVDAGASEITLIVKEAGRTLIQVIDNGKGMSITDARLCWERHATSKIKDVEDIFKINTFGFRGEALASIAAVAQVEMRTRQANNEMGTLILIEGSEVKKQENCVGAVGTNIAVRNLFYNVPARRNFLKSNTVELKHIIEELIRVALPNPQVHFVFTHNDSNVFDWHAGTSLKRLADILQIQQADIMSGTEEVSGLRIEVFAGVPETAKKTRGDQYLIINGRFVKDAYLNHAVSSVFADYLPQGYFPLYVAHISLPPNKVDINIHPAKTEVKFEDEKLVYAILKSTVKMILGNNLLEIENDKEFDNTSFASFLQAERNEFPAAPKVTTNSGYNPFEPSSYASKEKNLGRWKDLFGKPQDNAFSFFQKPEEEELLHPVSKPEQLALVKVDKAIQLFKEYAIAGVHEHFLLIALPAAQLRVNYEKCLFALQSKSAAIQQLLFPRTIQFHPTDSLLFEELLPQIKQLGFDVEPFGNNVFIINGVPAEMDKASGDKMLEDILHEFKELQSFNQWSKAEKLAYSFAVKTILKDYTFKQEELNHLIQQLMACADSLVAPNGQLILKKLSQSDLKNLFL